MNLRDLKITPDLFRLVSEVDEFKGGWKFLGTLSPERLRSLKHVAKIESIGSSTRIEGSTLSDGDVEQLMAGLETQSFSSRYEQEVAGYAQAMDLVCESSEDILLSENFIKQLHRVLLRHSDKDEQYGGECKKHPTTLKPLIQTERVWVRFFRPPPPLTLPERCESWRNGHVKH